MATYGRLVFNDAGIKDVALELEIEAVRRARVETAWAEEAVKEFGFRRSVLVAVLCILGLVVLGSLAVAAAGLVLGVYPLVAVAVAPLSGSGGLGVLAWRTYAESSGPESKPS